VPLEETLTALDSLVRRGVVRQVGVSNFTPEQLDATMKLCERLGLTKLAAVQPAYSFTVREPEKKLFPYCVRHGLGVFAYSPLWGGFLTGKYKQGAPPPEGSTGGLASRAGREIHRDSWARSDRVLGAPEMLSASLASGRQTGWCRD
jgi:aryl-alcohol dehydrogenase-like predicted oxidoreductase